MGKGKYLIIRLDSIFDNLKYDNDKTYGADPDNT